MIILGGLVTTVSMLFTIGTNFYGLPNPLALSGLLDCASLIAVLGPVIGGNLMAYGSELSTAFKTDPTRTDLSLRLAFTSWPSGFRLDQV